MLDLLVSGKDFKPKSLATIDLTLPNCLEKELVIQRLVLLMMLVRYNTRLGSIDVQERNLLFKGLFSFADVSLKIRKEGF